MASKIKRRPGSALRVGIMAIIAFAVLLYILLQGHNIALVTPKGFMADEQLKLIIFAAVVPLIIAVPTVAFLYYTAWKYRETNTRTAYEPNQKHGKLFNAGIWLLPATFMLIISVVLWTSTHRLEPQKPIATSAKPMTIQV